VLVVHLFGRCAPLPALLSACAERGVPLVEDAAQAIGAGGIGQGLGAALSFFPSKNLGGFGDGGAVVTNDSGLARRVRSLRNHGAGADKMRHEHIGGNFQLDELQASLLRVKFPWLPRWTEARRAVARAYQQGLRDLPVGLPPPDDQCVWNQFVIRVAAERREALREHLRGRGIDSAIYYPTPLHLQPALRHLGGRNGDFPNAERAAAESLALPISPALTESAIDRVTAALRAFFA
jgi:dTDP-4-amino-4,6-dideoxygalactose transaminase